MGPRRLPLSGLRLPAADPAFWADLDRTTLPRHVAFIMDGNGRWAQHRGLPRIQGHRAGAETLRFVANCLNELGVAFATFFAFSKENWNRPRAEVEALMRLVRRYLSNDLREAAERNIRLRIIGNRADLAPDIRRQVAELEEETASNTGLTLVIAVSYSGQDEIRRAGRRMVRAAVDRGLGAYAIRRLDIRDYLDTAGMPDPDLLIRTSGEVRVSNFLLWQLAYTELYFSNVLWPDFREAQLKKALRAFGGRERRYGRTAEQLKPSPISRRSP